MSIKDTQLTFPIQLFHRLLGSHALTPSLFVRLHLWRAGLYLEPANADQPPSSL